MTEILTPTKALTVNPLKASQPIGASLAFLGIADCMPLEHGARGCTSFNKLFFMRHFNEPIALQTTAMDQTTTVLGADDNVVEALATICKKNHPERDRPGDDRPVGNAGRRRAAHDPGVSQETPRDARCRGRAGQRQRHARLPRDRLRRRRREHRPDHRAAPPSRAQGSRARSMCWPQPCSLLAIWKQYVTSRGAT